MSTFFTVLLIWLIVFDVVAKIMAIICVIVNDKDLTRKGFNTIMFPFGYVCYIPKMVNRFMKNLRRLE